MKQFLKKYAVLFLIAGTIVVLDQVTKSMVKTNLGIGQIWSPWDWLTPYARIVHIFNTGVAFGLFQGQNAIFSLLAIIVSIAIIYYYPRVTANDWILRVALGLQLGGALGNLVDRITQGYVTDFISVGDFAIFNIADASITVGVAVLLLGIWLQERRKKTAELSKVAETQNPGTDDKSGAGE
ncbi:MAG TPA: signal peptidase II [Anaerolineaceae bacterium]|nr:signal peptidase II [Anaerolineaceae bacterium]